jgi:hypothetical protein
MIPSRRTTRWVAGVLLLTVPALAGVHLHADNSHPCVVCKSIPSAPAVSLALGRPASFRAFTLCFVESVPAIPPLSLTQPRAPPVA